MLAIPKLCKLVQGTHYLLWGSQIALLDKSTFKSFRISGSLGPRILPKASAKRKAATSSEISGTRAMCALITLCHLPCLPPQWPIITELSGSLRQGILPLTRAQPSTHPHIGIPPQADLLSGHPPRPQNLVLPRTTVQTPRSSENSRVGRTFQAPQPEPPMQYLSAVDS